MGCSHSDQHRNTEQEQPRPKVVKAGPAPEASAKISNKLALGAGCYWGTEKYVKKGEFIFCGLFVFSFYSTHLTLVESIPKDFQKKFPGAIKEAKVGFMSPLDKPRIKNPTYFEVCSGRSGHVEVLFVELNDPQKHFEELCRFFFTFHDPTLKDRQGNDRGFQYSSWIFCGDDEQFEIAKRVKGQLQIAIDQKVVKVFQDRWVVTKICELKEFTVAQAAHQEYLFKNPNGYCNHRIRMKQWFEPK